MNQLEELKIEYEAARRLWIDAQKACKKLALKVDELKRKAKIIKVGNLIPPDFAPLSISTSIMNLEDPESAYLYGWESAILECGEILSK